ncbi:hypothetical protein KAR91_61070 [Candidatus Pacearchaeota archaeon]|nr:hypothetical protein [Candidatus Pacearchaeota archaeon]
MGSQPKDISGQRFGKLVAVSLSHMDNQGRAVWNAICDCGKEVQKKSWALVSGNTRSCGCLIRKGPITHGKSHSKAYRSWNTMRQRCSNKNNHKYGSYGGRGITVCERWSKFENFLEDMGEKPDGMSIDRRNNDGDYAPENCRWATPIEQARNKRNNRLITYNGITKSIAEWSEDLQINYGTLVNRVSKGWTDERALTQPVGRQGGHCRPQDKK